MKFRYAMKAKVKKFIDYFQNKIVTILDIVE